MYIKGHYQESVKASYRMGENTLQIMYLIKDWYPEYIKKSYNSTTTKKIKQPSFWQPEIQINGGRCTWVPGSRRPQAWLSSPTPLMWSKVSVGSCGLWPAPKTRDVPAAASTGWRGNWLWRLPNEDFTWPSFRSLDSKGWCQYYSW